MPPENEPTLHGLDKALASHIAECTQQNKQMWHELRGLKRAVWTAVGLVTGTLATVCGALLKTHLHL